MLYFTDKFLLARMANNNKIFMAYIYIDIIESNLEKKNKELAEVKDKKLKASWVQKFQKLGLSEDGWVCNKCWHQTLGKKQVCQITSCTSSNKSPRYVKRVCTPCYINIQKCFVKSVTASSSNNILVKKNKVDLLLTILKPRLNFPRPISDHNYCKVDRQGEFEGGGWG